MLAFADKSMQSENPEEQHYQLTSGSMIIIIISMQIEDV
jgi:hypothetical protein